MAYASWSVIYGEIPSATKWNILGSNDASFNDGTGIATGAVTSSKISGIDKSLTTTDSNPYKFKAYMNATQSLSAATWTKLNMDTESYDTNNNFNTTTKGYTVPVNGFYTFYASAQLLSQAGTVFLISLTLNGTSEWRRLGEIPNTTGNITLNGCITEQMTAGDVVYAMGYSGSIKTINSGVALSYFGGYLVSRT